MAYAKDIYAGDGSTTVFNVTFPYLSQDHVEVEVDEVVTSFSWVTSSTISITPAPAVGARVAIFRVTPITTPVNDFENGSVLNEEQLDNSFLQTLYVTQEAYDNSESAMLETTGGYFDAESKQIKNVADATDDNDATNKAQVLALTDAQVAEATAQADYSEEWATKAEDSLISVAAGGDGSTDYSSLHWAAKSSASATASAASAAAALASENAAAISEANASSSETAAAASAAAATDAAASLIWNDVVFKSFADSPITIAEADRGILYVIDTSGGNVVVTLPSIAGVTMPFSLGVKKSSADGNTVTVNASGSEVIDGDGSFIIQSQDAGATLVADTDPTPDEWTALSFGRSTGNLTVDTFTDGVDFTAGTTTQLTLSVAPGTENNVQVSFDGVNQHHDQFTVSGSVVTFSSAIPVGVSAVECVTGTTTTLFVPADASVTTSKIDDGAVTTSKLDDAAVTTAKIDDGAVTLAKIAAAVQSMLTRRNILFNTDFAINQRGYTSGSSLPANTYGFDRWRGHNTIAGSTHTLSDGVVTIDHTTPSANGFLVQLLEAGTLEVGKTYTLSWKGTAEAVVWYADGQTGALHSGGSYTFVAATTSEIIYWEGDGVTVSEMKLEEGASVTAWEKPDIPTELVRCQRYFQTSYDIGVAPGSATTWNRIRWLNPSAIGNSSNFQTSFPFRGMPMRDAPIITVYSTSTGTAGYIYDETAAADSPVSVTNARTSQYELVNTKGSSITAASKLNWHFKADAEL